MEEPMAAGFDRIDREAVSGLIAGEAVRALIAGGRAASHPPLASLTLHTGVRHLRAAPGPWRPHTTILRGNPW
jgi:hypothetical protein